MKALESRSSHPDETQIVVSRIAVDPTIVHFYAMHVSSDRCHSREFRLPFSLQVVTIPPFICSPRLPLYRDTSRSRMDCDRRRHFDDGQDVDAPPGPEAEIRLEDAFPSEVAVDLPKT